MAGAEGGSMKKHMFALNDRVWVDDIIKGTVICIDRDAPMYMVIYKDKQSEWVHERRLKLVETHS